MSSLATAVTPHLFWITSRAAGTAALLLSSMGVCAGLLIGSGLTRLRVTKSRKPDLRAAHEALALATIAAIVVHATTLLGDGYLRPSVLDVSVPFVSSYKEPWMAIGIVAGWGLTLLALSYYVRGRIGIERWRILHRFTALAWMLGIAHSLGEGTDAGQAWFLAMVALAIAPALVLLALRWSGTRRVSARRISRPGAPGSGLARAASGPGSSALPTEGARG